MTPVIRQLGRSLVRWLRLQRDLWLGTTPEIRSRRSPRPSKFQQRARTHD